MQETLDQKDNKNQQQQSQIAALSLQSQSLEQEKQQFAARLKAKDSEVAQLRQQHQSGQ